GAEGQVPGLDPFGPQERRGAGAVREDVPLLARELVGGANLDGRGPGARGLRGVTGHERDTLAGAPGGLAATAPGGSRVVEVDPVDDPRWDTFVRQHSAAGPYHLGAWARILGAAYGFEPAYLALDDGTVEIRGGLPLMRTRRV